MPTKRETDIEDLASQSTPKKMKNPETGDLSLVALKKLKNPKKPDKPEETFTPATTRSGRAGLVSADVRRAGQTLVNTAAAAEAEDDDDEFTGDEQTTDEEDEEEAPKEERSSSAFVVRPSPENFWSAFGDQLSQDLLRNATNPDDYREKTYYFHARLSLFVRGLDKSEIDALFKACIPTYIILPGTGSYNSGHRAFVETHAFYKQSIIDAVKFFAGLWMKSPAGVQYSKEYIASR